MVVRIMELRERCRQRDEELALLDSVVRAAGYVQWLVDDDAHMGEDNNNVWDWDGNNNE